MRPALLVGVCALCCCGAGQAEETGRVSAAVDLTFLSADLWRGFVLDAAPSLQPTIAISAGGFTGTVSGSLSRRPMHNQAWTGTDMGVEWARRFGRVEVCALFTEYTLPDFASRTENHSEEFGAGITADTLLQPSFRYYRDVTLGKGSYYFAGFAHTLSVKGARRFLVTLSGGAGLNQHLFQRQTTISDVDLSVAVTIPAGKLEVTPQFTAMRGHRSLFGTHAAFGIKIAAAY
jgi:hypothetical protein